MFNNFFSKIVPFMLTSKNTVKKDHKRRKNMDHAICMLDKQGYMHARLRTHKICNTYCFSTENWLRQHILMLLYTHIACLVIPTIRSLSEILLAVRSRCLPTPSLAFICAELTDVF
jgi:hypothetical protein